MKIQDRKTIVVIVCPESAWLQIEETLQTDLRAANLDQGRRAAIAKAHQALTAIEGPNAQPLFGFRVQSAIVKGWVDLCRLWGRLSASEGLLVATVPLPDDEYQVFVREERADVLDEALKAIEADHPGARKGPAPDAHLEEAYEDRVSGPSD